MAARGRRVNRVTVHTISGVATCRIGRVEAEQLREAGELYTSHGLYYWSKQQRQSPLSPVNLTSADMQGVVERRPRAIVRVKNWPLEHDRRAVTVIAGRGAWIPDAATIEIRSKLMQQQSHAKRYAANAPRN
jgi:hypothetical protein